MGIPEAKAFVAPTNAFLASSTSPFGTLSPVGVQERGSGSRQQQGVCHMVSGGRTPFIAGNWKMNPLDLASAKDLARKVIPSYVRIVQVALPRQSQQIILDCTAYKENRRLCVECPRNLFLSALE